MADDHSPGDRRQPYSDQGGPAGRHAETHDVRREARTNPEASQSPDPSFDAQLAPLETRPGGGHGEESVAGDTEKALHERLPGLTNDELARLSLLEPGARLEQGALYLDLNRPGDGPFQAIGGQEATRRGRLIAKRDTDYELWNRLAGEDSRSEIERSTEAQ